MYEYRAKVIRVVDGDTFDLEVDPGFHLEYTDRFRLYGFDTPECRLGRGCTPLEKEIGLLVKEYVKQLIEGKTVTIRTYKEGSLKRWLCDIDPQQSFGCNLGSFLHEHDFASGSPKGKTKWRNTYRRSDWPEIKERLEGLITEKKG